MLQSHFIDTYSTGRDDSIQHMTLSCGHIRNQRRKKKPLSLRQCSTDKTVTLWRIPCPWAMTDQFQLNFYFQNSEEKFLPVSFSKREWWKSSFPWPPRTRGPSFIRADATEQNYQLNILQVLLPYRRALSKAKLKRTSLRIAKDISVHQAFSLSNLKVFLQTPEVLAHWWNSPSFSGLQNG